MNARTHLTVVLALIALTGSGCAWWKPTPQQTIPKPQQKPIRAVSKPTAEKPVIPTETPVQRLRTIVDNFQHVKTYKSDISFPSSNGAVSGTLNMTKPDRIQLSLSLGTSTSVDMVMAEKDFFMRINGGRWMKRSQANANAPGTTDIFASQKSMDGLKIADDQQIDVRRDEDQDCDAYTFQPQSTKPKPGNMTICAADDLPRYVTMEGTDGPVTIEYHDFNSVFLIEKPI